MVTSAIALGLTCGAVAPARAALVTVFELPPSLTHPYEISPGPDGALWFTQFDPDRAGPQASILGRITPAGEVSAVRLPAGTEPQAITSGSDGALWYAARGRTAGRLGRVTAAPAGEFALPPGSSAARGITTGPDGALWFTTHQRIGRFVPGEAMTFFRVPGARYLSAIARGSDDALWFVDRQEPAIRRITTAGVITRFALPFGAWGESVAAAADGGLWFTTAGPSRLGRIAPGGQIRMYRLPQTGNAPGEVTAGPDGAIWFTHLFGIGRITPGGEITELAVPQPDDEDAIYRDITSGADGSVWFTQQPTFTSPRGEIGRIDLARHADQLLVTRLADGTLRGRAGRTVRIAFTATHDATGSLRLDLGRKRGVARQSVRAQAGANTATLRLPRRAGAYKLILRLSRGGIIAITSLGTQRSQSASDSIALTVTR